MIFEGKVVPARGIARLAARNQVALGRLAATHYRHEVVHGQFSRSEITAAMVANPVGTLAFPPLALAQLTRLLPLATYRRVTDFDQKCSGFHQRSLFSGTIASNSLNIRRIRRQQ